MDGKDRPRIPIKPFDPGLTPQKPLGCAALDIDHFAIEEAKSRSLLDDGLDRIRMNPPRFHHGATEVDRLCGRIKDSMILDFTTGAGRLAGRRD